MKSICYFFRSSRRALLVMVCLMTTLLVMAKPITREQALQKASSFLLSRPGSRMLSPVVNSRKLAPKRNGVSSSTELYYVFNRGNQEGYIIMPGDDRIESALGYTDQGEFDFQTIPDNMKAWLNNYADYIEYLQNNPNEAPAKAPSHPAIPKMLTCTWNQGSPFNDECPMYFTIGRSVTGCVATAMAQVMYYNRTKSVTETQDDIPAYYTSTSHQTFGQLHVDGIPAGSPIDWDNMLDSYNGSYTAKQRLAVAQLMHYCGVSVEMDYTNSSSGAQIYRVVDALKKYFGYTSPRYIEQSSYTYEGWDAVIYNELEQGRVVYLGGWNSEGGHAFVCDGHDGNQCFHINWGWGGVSDGFFLLSSLNPSSQGIGGSGDGYSQNEVAIIGCEPDNYGDKEMPIANSLVKKLCLQNWDVDGNGTFTYDEAASVTDLGTVFRGQRITSFPELYNFTGLTVLSDSAFEGCTSLSSVKLPKKLKQIGAYAFKGCRSLNNLKLPDNIKAVGKAAFAGCRSLPNQILPSSLTSLADSVFAGCQAFTTVELPLTISYIGSQAFEGCTKLTSFTVSSVVPKDIEVKSNVFEGIDLSKATLNVSQGTLNFFASEDQWKEFGTIVEIRTLNGGKFADFATDKTFLIYNEGTGRFLSKGEAWGTQAIVDPSPMRFQVRHDTSMPEGVYYLYSEDTGKTGYITFRTTGDDNVGKGVQACFVDGDQSHLTDKTAWWTINEVGDALYTIQIPEGQNGYDADCFLGVQTDHASNAAIPTYGAYSDVSYSEYAKNCQWRFVEYDEITTATFEASKVLANLLTMAKSYGTDYNFELAVYNDMNSTIDQIEDAQRTLRKKLNLINFCDPELRADAISYFDVNQDGEISYSEASKITDFGYFAFVYRSFTDLSDLKYFKNAEALYGNSFNGNTELQRITLPENLQYIYYNVFRNCSSLKEITLPHRVSYLGEGAFEGCTSLKSVTVLNPNPSTINIESNTLFKGVNLSKATLYVPKGSKELYAQAAIWKEFGKIEEVRGKTSVGFSPLETDVDGYIYNLLTGKYIRNGEAYGTQAVVGSDGLIYQFRHIANTPSDVFILYSANAGGNHVLFRTTNDAKVGKGVKACFVDGSSGTDAYWKVVQNPEDLTFTMQVPSSDASYVAGQYLGTQYDHESNYAPYGTDGIYWDIEPGQNPRAVQWAFIKRSDVLAAEAFDEHVAWLKELLQYATAKNIDCSEEQAVYDNLDSNEEEVMNAIQQLRHKLGYIDFADSRVKTICVNNWDDDDDGELSYEEAAAVTDLGTVFRSYAITSFEELQYFTSLTSIPDEAFKSCSKLVSIYLPAGVTTLGKDAFTSCSALKYIVALSPTLVNADKAYVTRNSIVFVPASLIESYQADAGWSNSTIVEYTGIPTVTAENASRDYARVNPTFKYTVSGAPINGEPELVLLDIYDPETGEPYTDALLPAGEYVIQPLSGNITSKGLVCVPGTLTVNKVTLTVTAKSYTRYAGEENPVFELTYKGFKNKEKAETALSVQPTVECDATIDSPVGEYEIRVFGAEANNYDIVYVFGTLTVEPSVSIESLRDSQKPVIIYDLQGRLVKTPQRGLYIINGKKTLVR